MMSNIDLQAIIEIHMVDANHIAELLFPENKHPKLALNRILNGEANLEADQISRLALFLDVDVDDLYNEKWKKISISKNVVTFTFKDYVAKLHLDSWTTRIFHKNSLFHESSLHRSSITLSEYFDFLNNQITKYNKDGIKN